MKAYQIKIEFLESNPVIWRRIVMPAGATFYRLHQTIQTVTNFMSYYEPYHFFEIELSEENMIITDNDEVYQEHQNYKNNKRLFDEQLKEIEPEFESFFRAQVERLNKVVRKPSTIKIDQYIEKYGEFLYHYDFGDGWKLLVTLEKVVDDHYYGYPILIDGEENAPPEDVGGMIGYYQFLEAYYNPSHPEHHSYRQWANPSHYREYDKDRINESLKFFKYKKTEWDKIND